MWKAVRVCGGHGRQGCNTELTGKKLGKYEIRDLIGSGGMGKVYLAWDPRLERPVAIKVLHAELSIDKDYVSRFIREAKAAAKINESVVAQVYDVGREELEGVEYPYIVMEFVKGRNLHDELRENGPVEEDTLLDYARQMALAVETIHHAGIIHRDIKPANFILREDGVLKMTDFGLARISESSYQTQPGTILGTVAYSAPEQLSGETVDERSDIYSIGVSLYELGTGKVPFDSDSLPGMIFQITNKDAPPVREPSTLNAELSHEFDSFVLKLMEREPDARTSSTADLLSNIEKLKSGERTRPEPETVLAPAAQGEGGWTQRTEGDTPAPAAPSSSTKKSGSGLNATIVLTQVDPESGEQQRFVIPGKTVIIVLAVVIIVLAMVWNSARKNTERKLADADATGNVTPAAEQQGVDREIPRDAMRPGWAVRQCQEIVKEANNRRGKAGMTDLRFIEPRGLTMNARLKKLVKDHKNEMGERQWKLINPGADITHFMIVLSRDAQPDNTQSGPGSPGAQALMKELMRKDVESVTMDIFIDRDNRDQTPLPAALESILVVLSIQ